MAKPPQDVTDAELAVLQVLWSEGPATIRQLTETIYPDSGPGYYATVQKLLEFDGKVYKGPPIHPTAIAPTESPIRA